mgnify:CR=1 FL=1
MSHNCEMHRLVQRSHGAIVVIALIRLGGVTIPYSNLIHYLRLHPQKDLVQSRKLYYLGALARLPFDHTGLVPFRFIAAPTNSSSRNMGAAIRPNGLMVGLLPMAPEHTGREMSWSHLEQNQYFSFDVLRFPVACSLIVKWDRPFSHDAHGARVSLVGVAGSKRWLAAH